MKYISTLEGLERLNELKLTEIDIRREHKQLYELEHNKKTIGDIDMNWRNENIVIAPKAKDIAIIYIENKNVNLNKCIEIEYKENKWNKK